MENNDLFEQRKVIDEIDRQMALLFEKRMKTAGEIAEIKKRDGISVEDADRERKMFENNTALTDGEFRKYYFDFLKNTVAISKKYQNDKLGTLTVSGTAVSVCHGAVNNIGKYCRTARRAFVVADSGVPAEYVKSVSSAFKESTVFIFEKGEENKNFTTYTKALKALCDANFTRDDVVVAVGGGVVGDVAGFVAATYMRGISFINIPTTLLSQVDSCVGGKTAVDIDGYKNLAGAFYCAETVIIDPDVLKTLEKRRISDGLAECIKIAALCDEELFVYLENTDTDELDFEKLITRCIELKKEIVELDEKEKGLRRALNFGHTVGHAIESAQSENGLFHGECVAIGMVAMSSGDAKKRLKTVLEKHGLPLTAAFNEKYVKALTHDKKTAGDGGIRTVLVNDIGSFAFQKSDVDTIEKLIKEVCLP